MSRPTPAGRGIFCAIIFLALVFAPTAAFAHASLLRSDPADRTVVARSPDTMRLTFNEPVSPLVLRLVEPSGRSTDLKAIAAVDETLTITLPDKLSPGTHLLSWRVVSADGHPVGGALTFSIGEPGATPPSGPVFESSRWAIWMAKVGVYLGLFVGVGGVFYAAWIGGRPLSQPARRWVGIALNAGLFATVCAVGLQGADALALPWTALGESRVWRAGMATSFGVTAAIACGAMAVSLAAIRTAPPTARWLSTLALAGVGLALAASGHAGTAEPRWLMRTLVFLHGVAIAFWIGALLPLRGALGRGQGAQRLDELLRFSRAIPVPFVILIASGIGLAVVQVRQADALWTTAYGLVLDGKLVVVAGLVVLAIVNRRLTPAAVAGDVSAIRGIRGSIQLEMALMLLVLGMVALWRFTPPPRALLAAAQTPIAVHIHTGQAMADIEIEPRQPGAWRIVITILDGQFAPLAAKEVTLFLSRPDAGIEPLRLPARLIRDTTWEIAAVAVPASGRWRARVEILVTDFDKIAIEDDVELR